MAKTPPIVRSAPQVGARSADVHLMSGQVLLNMKRWDDALVSLKLYLAAEPRSAQAWDLCGQALMHLGRLDQAGASFGRALEVNPQLGSALVGLGEVRERAGDFGGALACFEQALALTPQDMAVESKRGVALFCLRRFEEAADSFGRVTRALPQYAQNWHNWGSAAREVGDLATARSCVERALQLAPDMGAAHFNLGNILRDELKIEQAIGSYRRSAELQPDDGEAPFVIGVCQLLLGRFQEGWKAYEKRWSRPRNPVHLPCVEAPRWRGHERLDHKRLLLLAEQGLGDTIQFCRFAPLLASKGARVSLVVPRALIELLSTLQGVDQLVAHDEELPPADFHCPLLSLPLALNLDAADIPAPIRYLRPSPQRVAQWERQLGPRQADRPRIGLVWAGNRGHENDHRRSMPLSRLLEALPGRFACYGLQKEITEQERDAAGHGHFTHLGPQIGDFADTAALVDLMDAVVAVDTSVAHVGGALNKPTHILLPFSPDWRWQLNRTDSPWYPSVTLHRQQAPGDWSGALASLARSLATV
jgi:tetratricopeptide (TPR) repeat protein